MVDIKLLPTEQECLSQVLETRLKFTRKGTPALQPLSFYSSELKGRKQIAELLLSVRDHHILSENEISRARYFNTLSNQGLVDGSQTKPELKPAAKYYLDALDSGADDEFWRDDRGDDIEYKVIRELIESFISGNEISDTAKIILFNAQTFFDSVPEDEIEIVLSNRELLLQLFKINSQGREIARFFELSPDERQAFIQVFSKIPKTEDWTPTCLIEKAASMYVDAATNIQSDVRFRISGFLKAFRKLRTELGKNFPRLDKQLIIRLGLNENNFQHKKIGSLSNFEDQPKQMIVTGCPGSGKSHYIGQLISQFDCEVFRTQFHPESSYFEFVGAFKPYPLYEPINKDLELIEGDGEKSAKGRPLIDYRFVPGPFMQALRYAYENPERRTIVLIEELNRGNAAAILGDMLQLLDRDESGQSVYSVLASREIKNYFLEKGISLNSIVLPSNFYIWATMNSADQGVFPLDTAFRRRWKYTYKGYSEKCSYPPELAYITYEGKKYKWDKFREALNQQLIELGIHEDKLIGPYFLTLDELSRSDSILEKLFLYLWEDVLRFKQNSLFKSNSFSSVSSDWQDGKGSPLIIDLTSIEQDS